MSNLPTKTMIKEWIKDKKYKATDTFTKTKKAEILRGYLGTETEVSGKEWDECVIKMRALHAEMNKARGYSYGFNYSKGEYLEVMVESKFKHDCGAELETIRSEFEKILRNVDRLNSPKQMLEYLKTCEMEYPLAESAKAIPNFVEVDVTVYKPWIQNQLASGAEV